MAESRRQWSASIGGRPLNTSHLVHARLLLGITGTTGTQSPGFCGQQTRHVADGREGDSHTYYLPAPCSNMYRHESNSNKVTKVMDTCICDSTNSNRVTKIIGNSAIKSGMDKHSIRQRETLKKRDEELGGSSGQGPSGMDTEGYIRITNIRTNVNNNDHILTNQPTLSKVGAGRSRLYSPGKKRGTVPDSHNMYTGTDINITYTREEEKTYMSVRRHICLAPRTRHVRRREGTTIPSEIEQVYHEPPDSSGRVVIR